MRTYQPFCRTIYRKNESQEGINKIDLYTYGGYRAKMTNIKIVGK